MKISNQSIFYSVHTPFYFILYTLHSAFYTLIYCFHISSYSFTLIMTFFSSFQYLLRYIPFLHNINSSLLQNILYSNYNKSLQYKIYTLTIKILLSFTLPISFFIFLLHYKRCSFSFRSILNFHVPYIYKLLRIYFLNNYKNQRTRYFLISTSLFLFSKIIL